MKKLLFGFVLAFTFSGIAQAQYPNAIAVQDAKVWLDQGKAILVDVREQSEIAAGIAEPAQWYPKSSIDIDLDAFVKHLAPVSDKELILYCRSGSRASVVVQALANRGLKAWNMGAFKDWVDAGYPVR